jgi:hypothetical protein
MRMEKKTVLKEDGRYLVYYHFPESATPEETATYAAIEPERIGVGQTPQSTIPEEEKHGV